MIADLLIKNIKTLYTPYLMPPIKGKDMQKILTIDNAFVACREGMIIGFGHENENDFIGPQTTVYDANQTIMLPGLIDAHTHLVHGGSRENEFELLRKGTPYLDILKHGGGILGTVEKTRNASFDELYEKAYKSLNEMMLYGVTTIEAKSGYGIELDSEIKQLEVAKKLNQNHPVTIYSTYLGAHAIPLEYQNDHQKLIKQIIADLSVIKEKQLAQAVDVFCETNVYSYEETKEILEKAKQLGFDVKIHADEIDSLGGVSLGVMLQATSVDHLMATKDEDMIKLAGSQTIANILPGTSFYLNKGYARARTMLDYGVALAISGDYNPGSCPTENFQLIMQLAANQLKLTPEEVLNAATINPAFHLKLNQDIGSIEVGKKANFVLMDAPNLSYILYHYGINHTKDVFINGRQVVKNRQIKE